MIEWDHLARHDADFDIRYLGTRMRQWMDADIQHALEHCRGSLDGDDSGRAFLATVELYRTLAERTAAALELPHFDHERVEAEIQAVLALSVHAPDVVNGDWQGSDSGTARSHRSPGLRGAGA